MSELAFDLDRDTQALLSAYGFDRALFHDLRARMLRGALSANANRLTADVSPPDASELSALPASGSDASHALSALGLAALRAGQVGCVVLAGGMATRFGGVVKAEVEALPGHSFLSLKLADIRRAAREAGRAIPVYVMSSFATHDTLRRMIEREQSAEVPIELFAQLVSLRLTPEGELFRGADGKPSPYAPGHGDLTFALRKSGLLARFLERGGRVLTVSNVDNLGATLDPSVLGAHLRAGVQMTIEVGRRTPGERGGVPARVGGKLQIVEDFRLPEGFSLERIAHFNTNTFVVDAGAIDRDFPLTWFLVQKQVEGRPAVQFEHLVGQLSEFLSCGCLEVARDGLAGRFQPVKDPQELALRRPEIERILRARGVI
jgi:UTP--glucose-1-phosphate uridylyltransferase